MLGQAIPPNKPMTKPTKQHREHLADVLKTADEALNPEQYEVVREELAIFPEDQYLVFFKSIQPLNYLRVVNQQLEFSDDREHWTVVQPEIWWPEVADLIPEIKEART